MKWSDALIIGIVVVIAYIIYVAYTKISGIVKPVTDLAKPIIDVVGKAAPTIADIITAPFSNTPIVKTPTDINYTAPSPLNFTIPITGIPGLINAVMQPIATLNLSKKAPLSAREVAAQTPSFAAYAVFPPLGIFEAVTKIPKLAELTSQFLFGKSTTGKVPAFSAGTKKTVTLEPLFTSKAISTTKYHTTLTNVLKTKGILMNKTGA